MRAALPAPRASGFFAARSARNAPNADTITRLSIHVHVGFIFSSFRFVSLFFAFIFGGCLLCRRCVVRPFRPSSLWLSVCVCARASLAAAFRSHSFPKLLFETSFVFLFFFRSASETVFMFALITKHLFNAVCVSAADSHKMSVCRCSQHGMDSLGEDETMVAVTSPNRNRFFFLLLFHIPFIRGKTSFGFQTLRFHLIQNAVAFFYINCSYHIKREKNQQTAHLTGSGSHLSMCYRVLCHLRLQNAQFSFCFAYGRHKSMATVACN